MNPELGFLMLFLSCIILPFGFPIAFSLAGIALLSAGVGAYFGAFPLELLGAFPQRLYALMNNESLLAIPFFMMMGVCLERTRMTEDLLEMISKLGGHNKGGLVYSVTLVGALLAATTGMVGATVITMTLIALPLMLKQGYNRSFACGSIAASGTLAQIIPPSLVLIVLSDQIATAHQVAQFKSGNFSAGTVTTQALFTAALLPGLALVTLYLIYQYLYLRKHPLKQTAQEERAACVAMTRQEIVKTIAAPLFLICGVMGALIMGLATATEAAGVGAYFGLLFAALRSKTRTKKYDAIIITLAFALVLSSQVKGETPGEQFMETVVKVGLSAFFLGAGALALYQLYVSKSASGERTLTDILRQSTNMIVMTYAMIIGASLVALVFRGYGADQAIESGLKELPGGTTAAIGVVMLVIFVLGFFIDFMEIVYIVVPVTAPILLSMSFSDGTMVDPLWLAVMIAVNLQTSFLTPPFGYALFYVAGSAPPGVTMSDIYRGIGPFVLLQLLLLVFLWFLPELATILPSYVLN